MADYTFLGTSIPEIMDYLVSLRCAIIFIMLEYDYCRLFIVGRDWPILLLTCSYSFIIYCSTMLKSRIFILSIFILASYISN